MNIYPIAIDWLTRNERHDYVPPNDNLADLNWLTDAHDAEPGMTVYLDHDNIEDGPVPYEIEQVNHSSYPYQTVISWRTETDGERRGLTAEEINKSPDVVVV